MPSAEPGQHMYMDFGFVLRSAFDEKDKDGKTVTSKDGKRAYLAIIDRSSQYTWVFTTSSKAVPLEPTKMILDKFKSKNKHRTIWVDQGGKLGKSKAFLAMIAEASFSSELTGSDTSAQNSLAENLNNTFGQIIWCILYSADLGPEYWSWALQHAVYIKNRIPHQRIKTSPYHKFIDNVLDLGNLRIFGTKIYTRKPGQRCIEFDKNTAKGLFLGYTATDKNIIYINKTSQKIKIATHVIFDEAHMTVQTIPLYKDCPVCGISKSL
jgi:hypothetical protein